VSLPVEILKKIQAIDLQTRRIVNNVFAGQYHSAFRGQGMTFRDFREYVPGDDVRSISWTVTARTGKPFVKQFDEEREMTLMLAVDISGSIDFGSANQIKAEANSMIAAILGFSAVKNNDPVGMLMFSDEIELYVPPKKGRGQVLRLLRDIFYYQGKSKGTRLGPCLQYLQAVLKKRSSIFVISDFFDDQFELHLKQLSKKHEVIAVVVTDPFERQLPNLGLIDIEDPETGDVTTIDTASEIVRRDFNMRAQEQIAVRDQMLKKAGVSRLDVTLGQDLVKPLTEFFTRRTSRR
jgi:uncharacterized protein (DUF58 family)